MLDGYPQDLLTRLQLWFLNEGINLIKITLVALLLLRILRWLTSKVPQWVQDPGGDRGDLQRQQQVHTMATVFNSVGAVLVIAVAGATALREFGLDVRPTLAGAGIIGITIGFGAQNLVRDLLSGVLILADNQYRIGDVIRTSGITGVVETMNLRRTVIRDADGAAHNIANGEIRIVANLTRTWARVSIAVPVSSDQPVDRVLEVLRATCQDLVALPQVAPLLLEAPQVLGIEKLGGRDLEILVQVRVEANARADVAREWRRLIKQAFETSGIPFQDLREIVTQAD